MKFVYSMLLSFILLHSAYGVDPVSTDDFKNASPEVRQRMIAEAPPEQKQELARIHNHLMLLQEHGDEETLKWWKENAVAKARGFPCLEGMLFAYSDLWSYYRSCIMDADEKKGMSHVQLAEVERVLQDERTSDEMRLKSWHALVFHLAPSPRALRLEKKAFAMFVDFAHKMGEDNSNRHLLLKKEDLIKASKQMDGLISELKQLPTLTAEQAQKEFDEFPESNML